MMRTLGLLGLAAATAMIPAGVFAASDSGRGAGPRLGYHAMGGGQGVRPPVHNGQWRGSWGAAGGWSAYRRPTAGWVLPRHWVQPGFVVRNFGAYGFSRPADGYRWSRYYGDAVLIDDDGRVHDSVSDVEWRDDERDDRWDDYDDDRFGEDLHDDGVTLGGTWRGAWTGSYDGGPVQRYEGEFHGAYHDRTPRQPHRGPHLDYGPLSWGGNGVSGGYYYPAPVVTTIVVHSTPTVTTTSFVEEEYVAPRPAWKPRAKHRWKPKTRTKTRCVCK